MEEVLRAWGLDQGEMHRIHPSAWEVEGRYVLKEYLNPEELEQNVRAVSYTHLYIFTPGAVVIHIRPVTT